MCALCEVVIVAEACQVCVELEVPDLIVRKLISTSTKQTVAVNVDLQKDRLFLKSGNAIP